MISVIICSVNAGALANVRTNIAETIGVPFEVIAIDNCRNEYGICRAYNTGGRQATFPLLCFMHEDILFETPDWGRLVVAHFEDPNTGLLGVAGGDSKSSVPSSWSVPVVSNEINIVQHYKSDKTRIERIVITNTQTPGTKKPVVAADGVWLCTRKKIFEEFPFDETQFPGFHGYDIDYSLQVGTRYGVYVIFDVVIHHFSEGTPDRRWVDSAMAISRKWRHRLPLSVYELSGRQRGFLHWHSLRVFLQHLFRLGYSRAAIAGAYLRYSLTPSFTLRRFLSMGRYVALEMYRKRSAAGKRRTDQAG